MCQKHLVNEEASRGTRHYTAHRVANGAYESTSSECTRYIELRICPIFAHSCQSASRVRLPRSPRANCSSVEYREEPGPRDYPRARHTTKTDDVTHRGVGRVHERARLFYLDAFPQLARSISHTQITHVPSPPSVPGNLCPRAGMPSFSFAIVLARPAASFDVQIARDQITSV